MKKLFLVLFAVMATSLAGFSQITLSDAYTSLVNQPGMVEKNIGTVQLTPTTCITNLQTVTAQSPRYAQEFVYTYESLPIQNMVIGANNRKEMACAFTEPSTDGVYNVLFLVGEKGGPYTAAYGQTTEKGLEAIRTATVKMKGGDLQLTVNPQIEIVEMVTVAVVE